MIGTAPRATREQRRAEAVRAAILLGIWLLVAVPATVLLFVTGSRTTELASHQAVVRPAFDGYATLELGPYIPDIRYPVDTAIGAHIMLGETDLTSYEALIRRYAVIGSSPEGEIAKLGSAMTDLAVDSALLGALVGVLGPSLWLLLGSRRRAELAARLRAAGTSRRDLRRVGAVLVAAALVAAVVLRVTVDGGATRETAEWRPIGEELRDIPIPPQAQPLEIQAGLMTTGTRRLAESAFDTYARSLRFYEDVLQATATLSLELRQPTEGELVALLVTDRHDNIGMDRVARAIADQGGATVLLDAGDDTSTGSAWEAFSLDSLAEAFQGFEARYAVAGNHDHGEFVPSYLTERGFTMLDGDVVDGPDGIRLLGANDPRSSGLGTWRDETGLSFADQAARIADVACERDADGDRIATLLVHDANSGRPALERGCVDLVLGGHLHAQQGPTLVIGENGRRGYTYTNGTTGGAAYALAIGSKLRRDAQVTLVTYREGRPVGLQPVTIRTTGEIRVAPYQELVLDDPQEPAGSEGTGPAAPEPTT